MEDQRGRVLPDYFSQRRRWQDGGDGGDNIRHPFSRPWGYLRLRKQDGLAVFQGLDDFQRPERLLDGFDEGGDFRSGRSLRISTAFPLVVDDAGRLPGGLQGDGSAVDERRGLEEDAPLLNKLKQVLPVLRWQWRPAHPLGTTF